MKAPGARRCLTRPAHFLERETVHLSLQGRRKRKRRRRRRRRRPRLAGINHIPQNAISSEVTHQGCSLQTVGRACQDSDDEMHAKDSNDEMLAKTK